MPRPFLYVRSVVYTEEVGLVEEVLIERITDRVYINNV